MHATAGGEVRDVQGSLEDEEHDEIFPDFPEPQGGGRWLAPTDVEQHLLKLSRAENTYAYLRTLAAEGVYYPARLDEVRDAGDDEAPMFTRERNGEVWVPVYTEGVLPRPHPQLVYQFATLGRLAQIVPAQATVLLVNGGTPCQELLAVDDEERDVWWDLHDELFDPDGLSRRVVTRRSGTGLPEPGPLLHGLACGAHLCYGNGDAWNTVNWHGAGYSNEVERLSEWWGVDSREDWRSTQERLLKRQISPWQWDFVLEARDALARANGGRVDEQAWAGYVESTVRERLRRRGGPAPGDEAEVEEYLANLRGLVGQVLRYEARFRQDGLLAEDSFVHSVAAWDLGRAAKMARWGRGARYATEREFHEALERAGAGARALYTSWEDFSAGYVLGRCLHFDEDTFGDWYTGVLEAHHALASDPESPWARVPFGVRG